jgi:hypothetical protein
VNDPYDGDWALNPLGGKQVKLQSLPLLNANDNIWNEGVMGTNSIFMHTMSSADAQRNLQAKKSPPNAGSMNPVGPDGAADKENTWVGTNQVFFGSNGGGNGWARTNQKGLRNQALRSISKDNQVVRDGYSNGGKVQSVPKLGGTNFAFNGADGYHYGWARKPQQLPAKSPRAQKSLFQSLFRSADAHEAEYGREGDNQLNDDVLPSAVGTGGPVIYVDGKPSNVDHAWAKHDEEFSFKCSDDILGFAGGLTVEPEYAAD